MRETGLPDGPPLYEQVDRKYNAELAEQAEELKRTRQISSRTGPWYVERAHEIESATATPEQQRKRSERAKNPESEAKK